MHDACERDAFSYNAEMKDDPALPEFVGERVLGQTRDGAAARAFVQDFREGGSAHGL